MLVGFATALFSWEPISTRQLGMFAINGLILGAAYFFLVEALRLAEASVVTPYKYVTLIWAVLIGLIIWGDIPTTNTLVGAVFVVGSGLFILHRELRRFS